MGVPAKAAQPERGAPVDETPTGRPGDQGVSPGSVSVEWLDEVQQDSVVSIPTGLHRNETTVANRTSVSTETETETGVETLIETGTPIETLGVSSRTVSTETESVETERDRVSAGTRPVSVSNETADETFVETPSETVSMPGPAGGTSVAGPGAFRAARSQAARSRAGGQVSGVVARGTRRRVLRGEPSGSEQVKLRMLDYARERLAAGDPVSGADLDRVFRTTNYGARVLRESGLLRR